MRKNAKKLFALILALCMSLTLLTACGGDTAGSDSGVGESSSGGETITWRLQSSYSLNSLQGDMATNLKEALETATNGRLQVELYEPGALCQTSDILTYLSQNAFDCAVIFGSTFSGLIPEADLACGIPFAWESSAEIYDVMENYGLLDVIQEANCVVAVAGMEGALASVMGGLVDKPVIAVPTSVGYGASMNGISALLTMINSCANGIAVVNIDNGYGAGYLATQINRLAVHGSEEEEKQ